MKTNGFSDLTRHFRNADFFATLVLHTSSCSSCRFHCYCCGVSRISFLDFFWAFSSDLLPEPFLVLLGNSFTHIASLGIAILSFLFTLMVTFWAWKHPHFSSPFRKRKMNIAIVHELLVKVGGAERVAKVLADMFQSAHLYSAVQRKSLRKKHFQKKSSRGSLASKVYRAGNAKEDVYFVDEHRGRNFWSDGIWSRHSSSSAFAHGILTPRWNKTYLLLSLPCPIFVGSDVFGTRATSTRGTLSGGKIVAPSRYFPYLTPVGWDCVRSPW